MSAIMSRPQCANVTHLRRDPKQMSCLQSKVFWVVHRPDSQRRRLQIIWVGGWYIVHPTLLSLNKTYISKREFSH